MVEEAELFSVEAFPSGDEAGPVSQDDQYSFSFVEAMVYGHVSHLYSVVLTSL